MSGFLQGAYEALLIIAVYEASCWAMKWTYKFFSRPRRPQPPPINWHSPHPLTEGDKLLCEFIARERAKGRL